MLLLSVTVFLGPRQERTDTSLPISCTPHVHFARAILPLKNRFNFRQQFVQHVTLSPARATSAYSQVLLLVDASEKSVLDNVPKVSIS
jgi:hypothetical protein